QILDQDKAQQGRQGPYLTDLHRLDGLEPFDDRLERLRRNGAVRMRDIGPGDRQGARHAGAVRKLEGRQLAVEAARQVALDLVDGFLDQIIVVEQPLRGWRNRFALGLCGVGRAIDLQYPGGAFADTGLEIEGAEPGQALRFAL